VENYIRDTRTCLSLKPDAITCKIWLAAYFVIINDFKNADKHLTEFEKQIYAEKSPQTAMPVLNYWTKYLRAAYFAKLGYKDQALALSKEAWIYAELGMVREAIHVLQEEFKKDKYATSYEMLLLTPAFDPIRNNPEFQKLLAQQKPLYDEMIRKYRIK